MTKDEAISILFHCVGNYHVNLANKNLLFVCKDKYCKISTVQVEFRRHNFLHLTGVCFPKDKAISPNNFYNLCLARRLSIDDFSLSHDGTTRMKLEVLPRLTTRTLGASIFGDYCGTKPLLFTEKLAGSVYGCLGFRLNSSGTFYIPDTVLKEDIRDIATNRSQIIAIYSKAVHEPLYNHLVKKAKDIDLTLVTPIIKELLFKGFQ